MRDVVVAAQVLVLLALVGRVNRDDWRGVRDAATAIIERDSR